MNTNIYKPEFTEQKVDYQKVITKTGEDYEVVQYYKDDPHMISNPPNKTKLIEKIIKQLRGSGIAKLSISFLNVEV